MLAAALIAAGASLATLLPLAWKWGLGVRRVTGATLALTVLSTLALSAIGGAGFLDRLPQAVWIWAVTVTAAFVILLRRFYRDPERTAPEGDDVIVSPADGEVVYVRASRDGKLPVSSKGRREYSLDELTKTPLAAREAVVVGIGLSFLDVHVNRSPVGGRVVCAEHHKGLFGSLKHDQSVFQNERATVVIERGGKQLAVVLIASRLVRRIVAFVREGDQLTCGQRIGAIRFGSQMDLVLPSEWAVGLRVSVGDRVTAGESVVALLPAAATEVPKGAGAVSSA